MKSVPPPYLKVLAKAPTDIAGFDAITGGGLQRGHTRMRELRGADAAKPGRK